MGGGGGAERERPSVSLDLSMDIDFNDFSLPLSLAQSQTRSSERGHDQSLEHDPEHEHEQDPLSDRDQEQEQEDQDPLTDKDPNDESYYSEGSGYPSWLPQRPPPPAPTSTLGQSSIFGLGMGGGLGGGTATPSPVPQLPLTASTPSPVDQLGALPLGGELGGRRPTSRSVRIVSLHDSRGGAAAGGGGGGGQSGVVVGVGAMGIGGKISATPGASVGVDVPPKVITRASAAGGAGAGGAGTTATTFGFASTAELQDPHSHHPHPHLRHSQNRFSQNRFSRFSYGGNGLGPGNMSSLPTPPPPRFKAKNLHLGILTHPSPWMKLYFYTWPLLVFYHVLLQSFLDFNVVYMILSVAKFPNTHSGGGGRNWALGAAAYIACWLVWVLVVCVVYEVVYSFVRRWRLREFSLLFIYLGEKADFFWD